MTNREENLKKINDKLEMLSDEQLEQVAGGVIAQTSDDSQFLYDYGLVDDWHSQTTMTFHWDSYSKAVDAGWAKAGITSVTSPWVANRYYINGKEISRGEAFDIVSKKFTKIHDEYDGPNPGVLWR